MNLGPTEQAVKCPSIQLCCCAAAVPLSTKKFTYITIAATLSLTLQLVFFSYCSSVLFVHGYRYWLSKERKKIKTMAV